MVLRLVKNIAKTFIKFYLRKDKDCQVKGEFPKQKNFRGRITLRNNSTIYFGKNVKFDGKLFVGKNSELFIGDESVFNNVNLYITNNSKVHFGERTYLEPDKGSNVIHYIDNGNLYLEGYNRLACNIVVRFGANLKVGIYTTIGAFTEIICEESVVIGSFGLFSYDICIYDTDSHSIDWQERRERIKEGFPLGTSEIQKPNTKPIVIGNDVWIGKGSTITKGTVIGDRSIVGIRTVVSGGIYPEDSSIVSNKPRVINRKIGV